MRIPAADPRLLADGTTSPGVPPSQPQLREYEFSPRPRGSIGPYDAAFVRKILIESEEQFKAECRRIGAVMAPMLVAPSSITCLNDGVGSTRFGLDFEKTNENPRLVETGNPPDPD